MKNIMILSLALSLGCNSATADGVDNVNNKNEIGGETIRLGEIVYGGNGCPEGTVVIEAGPNNNSLNLIFDQYKVVAGLGGGRVARKSCSLAMPIGVPKGLQIGILSAEFKGFVSLPKNATGRVTTEYFAAGDKGIVRIDGYMGTLGEEINILHEPTEEEGAIVWTPCGEDTNIRMNSSILVNTNETDEEAILSLDQASLIQLVIRECS
ncbi:MAG: hypothetical protein A4S09_06750 [Proteobacteria bacterium SG_bin7]|nr:MAG: hypothetical protein A4S09_06750 [Proteobacteria bacterium SG_bin7]